MYPVSRFKIENDEIPFPVNNFETKQIYIIFVRVF